MAKRTKKATINRIRYYNKQLNKESRISTSKKLSVKQLNQIERDIKARVYLDRAEFDVATSGVSSANLTRIKKISQAYKRQDTQTFEREVKKIKRYNKKAIQEVKSGLKNIEDIGSLGFTVQSLEEDPQNLTDVEILLQAVSNEKFAEDTIVSEIQKLNEIDAVKKLGGVDRESITSLDRRAKQYLKNVIQSPKIALTVEQDEFEIIGNE